MSTEAPQTVTTKATSASCLAELNAICKAHGIKNTDDYKKQYKCIPDLPAHPERIFKQEWISYSDFFDIPKFIPFEVLRKEVQVRGIKTQREYTTWIKSLNDPQYPRAPDETYKHEWENWFDFCDKEKPLKPKYIPDQYQRWADKIQQFMKQAYGGESKENSLCRFVRIYIEKHNKSKSPEELLTSEKVDVHPFREELKLLPSDNQRRNTIIAVNEEVNDLDRQEYIAKDKQEPFNSGQCPSLEFKVRKLESEYEGAAKKMDMLLCDLQSTYKLIQQCQLVANNQFESDDGNLPLIKKPESDIQIQIDDTSYFQQLHEICVNATIYEGSNPSRAIIPRSQLLERMASFNDLAPRLFMLSNDQQLTMGSQLIALFKARLKSWEKVNDLTNGHLKLSDLVGPEKIEPSELELITSDTMPALSQVPL